VATRLCEQVIVLRVERAIKLSRSVEKRRSSYSDVTPPVTPDGTYTETGVFSSPPDHVDARAVGRDGHAERHEADGNRTARRLDRRVEHHDHIVKDRNVLVAPVTYSRDDENALAVGRDCNAVWRVVHLDLPREFERVVWIAGHIEGHDRAPCIMSMLTSNVV